MDLPFPPMLLSRASVPFADSGWLYQVKWDGVRNLTLVESGRVRHWSRRGRDRSGLFPELGGLGAALSGTRAVLDGEIVVLRDGRPSFPGILERDAGGAQVDPGKVRSHPAVLMIFDLLEYGHRPLYQVPLEERLHLLQETVLPGPAWQVVASFPGEQGLHLFEAVAEHGLEGVVAKRLGSVYRPGVRSRDWVKIKRRRRILAVICGYTVPAGRSGSLLLGAFRENQLVYIGRVGTGIRPEDLDLLRTYLRPGPCPFSRPPSLRDRFARDPGPVVWTEPMLTAEVEFAEWTDELRLRDPVLVGFSSQPVEAARLD